MEIDAWSVDPSKAEGRLQSVTGVHARGTRPGEREVDVLVGLHEVGGRRGSVVAEGQREQRGLDGGRRAEGMSVHALRRKHERAVGTEDGLQRPRLHVVS